MNSVNKGVLGAGAALLWRQQRILWWIYAVNLLLGLFAALPFASAVGGILDHSLASERLVKGMDVATLIELAAQPGAPLTSHSAGALCAAGVFLVFLLFLTGGMLEVYRRDTKLDAGEFFRACGAFLGPFARLLGFFLVVLAPILGLVRWVVQRSDTLAGEATSEMTGFWVEVAGLLVAAFLLMTARLCFDMAEVRAVAEDERAMRRTLRYALRLTWHNFGSLFWIYLRISWLAWMGLGIAAWTWIRLVPPGSIAASFLLGQLAVLLWLAARLWLRSTETLWYQRYVSASKSAAQPSAPAGIPAAVEARIETSRAAPEEYPGPGSG
jgi:hypothetical protein